MDEKWINMARQRIEQRLSTLRRISAPAAIIAAEEARSLEEVARLLWAEAEAERPEVLAAFRAAHPNHEPHPEDDGVWVLSCARNQDEVDAWDAARQADLEFLHGVDARPGDVVTAPSSGQWERLATSWGWEDGGAVPGAEMWKRVGGPGRPERDFAPVVVVEWVLSRLTR